MKHMPWVSVMPISLDRHESACELDCKYAQTLLIPRIERAEDCCDGSREELRSYGMLLEALRVEQEQHARRISIIEAGQREQHAENLKTHTQIAELRAEIGGLRTEMAVISKSVLDTNVAMAGVRLSLDSHLDQARQIMLDMADCERRRANESSGQVIAETGRREKLIRVLLVIAALMIFMGFVLVHVHAQIENNLEPGTFLYWLMNFL